MELKEIRRFRSSMRRFQRVAGAQLKKCCTEVTLAQCLVLLEIDENQRLTMGDLASGLRLDNSTLSRTVDALVSSGHLQRLRDDRDRRVVWIHLTGEGEAACQAIHEENDAYAVDVLQKIPPSRRGSVIRSFETLVQAFLDQEAETVLGVTERAPVGKKETST
jgi:DNA-binding MarR family transcriptional regulator